MAHDARHSSRRFSLSLSAKICVTATVLVVASLGVTSAFIAVKNSQSAEEAAMSEARTLTLEASALLQGRIAANLAMVENTAGSLAATQSTGQALTREQVGAVMRAALARSEDFIGTSAAYEPDALDGRDAAFAGQ
ncbi:methyl-accepting chemotaxis protein, partial [Halobellus sp. Atlit-31R]